MATPFNKSGRGHNKGGEHRKRDGWRDYNKSGSSSPGPRRSNSPWHSNHRSDYKEHKDAHKVYAQYLSDEWKKVEQDLNKEPPKDSKITDTVEYIEKTLTDTKAAELFNISHYLNNREEKPSPPD